MSRSGFNIFFKQLLKSNEPVIVFTTGVSMISCNFLYAIFTREEKEIIVKKKYKFDRSGFTDFMVIDSYGNHYNVNNSFWYWKWDSIEDWSSIEANKNLNMKYYGWRVPILGFFPNIVSTQNNKNKKIDDNIVNDMSLIQDLSDGKFS